MIGDVVVETEVCSPPGHLSPSSISTWLQCPLRFKLGRIDKIPEPSTEAQILGSYTHEVLEYLYMLTPAERTLASAKALAKQLWEEKWATEVSELGLSVEKERLFRWNTWWCIEALFKLEDPSSVEIGATEQRLEVQFDDFRLIGILDRWQPNQDGTITISDYKTGKKPNAKYEGEKKFQLAIYKHLVESALEMPVGGTELLYLKEGIRWKFCPDSEFVKSTLSTVSTVAEEVLEATSTGKFLAKPAKLCDWCSFKGTCPAWRSPS